MSKKVKSLLIFIIVLLILGGIAVIVNNLITVKKDEPKPKKPVIEEPINVELDANQEKVIEMSNEFHSYLIDQTKTESDMEQLTGITKQYFSLMMSNDSSLRIKYPEKFKTQVEYNFDEAEKKQNRYLNKIYKQIKKSYSYKLVDAPLYTEDKKQLMQQTTITPFSYYLFERDLSSLKNKLLEMANAPELEENSESILYYYRAHIKALEILSYDLSNYTKGQKIEANMIYNINDNGSIVCENCHTYINYCLGMYSDKLISSDGVDYYDQYYEKRIDSAIKNAQKEKILDKKNPLK